MSKQEIRDCIKSQKKALTSRQIKNYSDAITQKFINQDFFINCPVLYAYASYNEEVLTDGIIKYAWQSGKKVAVPKTYDKCYMEFCYIDSFDELELGYCNIPEPTSEKTAYDARTVILMPGLAFDKNFNRIGYGGGFYDKYLSSHTDKKFFKAALAYDFQIFEKLETEGHDYKVDAIITPTKTYLASENI